MSYRHFLLFGAAAIAMAQTPAKKTIASARPAAAKSWTAPRTSDGQPDLQGIWSSESLTPFERPKEFEGKVTGDEARETQGKTEQSKADLKQAGEKVKDAFR